MAEQSKPKYSFNILVGAKSDLKKESGLPRDIQQFIDQTGIHYIESSAADNTGISEVSFFLTDL